MMRTNPIRLALLLLLATGIILALVYRDRFDSTALQAWVDSAGTAGPLLFIALYALVTVLFLPGSVITLAGGALFGPVWGTLYNLTGATLGAASAFLLARYLAETWASGNVEKRSGGRLHQLKQGVEGEGWRFVAFVRLVPLFPFNLLNYALGLTRIPFLHYLIATWLFMLPGAIAYTYLGYAGREAVAGGEGLIQKALLGLGLIAVMAFLPRIVGRLRQGPTLNIDELQQRMNEDARLLVLDVRSHEDYQGELGHIEGSRNIPLETLESHLPALASHLEQPIALVCTTDRRSKKAAQILGKEGFADVHVVLGGMTQWNKQPLPVETSS